MLIGSQWPHKKKGDKPVSIAGVDNGIVVSNATLRTMSSDAYGIWLGNGYNDERGASGLPSDCELVIENNDHDLVLRSPSKAATVIYMR